MANLKWEEIESEGTEAFAHRAEVPGGWLVLAQTNVCHQDPNGVAGMHPGWDWRPSLAFVPDPEHEWSATTVKDGP